MKTFFLSASVPDPLRDRRYFETADIFAIRDAVCALAQTILPVGKLVWGGHPLITPLIRIMAETIACPVTERVVLYQSKFFAGKMPEDNNAFEKIILTPDLGDRAQSLLAMRKKIFTDNNFYAGIFIGGMEGVEDEYRLFREYQPDAITLPIPTTGGAAKMIYDRTTTFYSDLESNYAYRDLFKRLLQISSS